MRRHFVGKEAARLAEANVRVNLLKDRVVAQSLKVRVVAQPLKGRVITQSLKDRVMTQSLKVPTAEWSREGHREMFTSAGRWVIECLSCLILSILLRWVIKLTTWITAAFIINRATMTIQFTALFPVLNNYTREGRGQGLLYILGVDPFSVNWISCQAKPD